MADYLIKGEILTEIADAIREKTGKAGGLTPTAMPEEIAGIQSEGGSAPADWNANEGEPGHIRNRPFYSQKVFEYVLPETQAIYDDSDGVFVVYGFVPLESGKTYTVSWNGTLYECTAVTVEGFFPVPVNALGDINGVLNGSPSGEYPFALAALPAEYVDGMGVMIMPFDGSTSLTISVVEEVESLKKMDSKYLPEGMPRSEFTNRTVLEETTGAYMDGVFIVEGKCNFVPGQEYTVNWNGTPYVCTAYDFALNGIRTVAIGDENVLTGGEPVGTVPFGIIMLTADMGLMISEGAIAYPADGSKTLKIFITGAVETVTPVAEKYLPMGVRTYVIVTDDGELTSGGESVNTEINYDAFAEILYNGGSVQLEAGGWRYIPVAWRYDSAEPKLVLYLGLPGGGTKMYSFNKGSWTPPTA